jgi:stress-induced-phosphoprotein 1
MGLGKIFSDPNMISKLAANPKTSKYLADPTFINTVRAFRYMWL